MHLNLGDVCFKYEKTVPEFTLKFVFIQLIFNCSVKNGSILALLTEKAEFKIVCMYA